MDTFLLLGVISVAIVRWFYVRQRMSEMGARIDALSRLVAQLQARPAAPAAPPRPVLVAPPAVFPQARYDPPPMVVPEPVVVAAPPPPVPPPPVVEPPPIPVSEPPAEVLEPAASVAAPPEPVAIPIFEPPSPRVAEPIFQREPEPEPAPRPHRSTADWEALVGGNLLNKAGVFVLVIGVALLLSYAFTRLGPAGRVAISIGVSLAMLVSGAVLEKRERYRTFAQGLLGGGWAALYFTVYAMQSLEAARVIYNPVVGAVLLLAVACGMIVHSLRYRSQTVTGLAYFIAFVTLAITQVTPLSVLALIPLAASLLYISHRFEWKNFAVFGLVATYAICASRGDSGAPLWQVQALFVVYWLLFETFDILRPHPALLPLNAAGFLGLSLVKWNLAAHDRIWQLLAATALAYLIGAALRWRTEKWQPAATLTAALAAAAIFLRLDYQWVALALLVEAELFYLAGIRLGAPYLRLLAGGLFTLELGHLVVKTVPEVSPRGWTPVAVANVVVFYANRALRSADTYYGFAAAALMALIAGFIAPHHDRGLAWLLLAVGPFLIGWRWRLTDFRLQAYSLAAIGPIGMAIWWPEPPLSIGIGAALAYAGALCARWSGDDRFVEGEQDALRLTASLFATTAAATVVWLLTPRDYLGLGWIALAVVVLELGMRELPRELRRQSYCLGLLGAAVVFLQNIVSIHNDGPVALRFVPAAAAMLAYAISARARREEGGRVLDFASFIGTGFLLTGLWALLPPVAVGPAWAVVGLALVEFEIPMLTTEAHLASLAAFARLFFANFDETHRLITALTVLPVMLAHYYLWSRTRRRFYLYTAGILAAVLPRFEMDRVFTATAWAGLTVVFLYAGSRWKLRDLEWQSYVLAAMAFARCWASNFYSPEQFASFAGPVLVGTTVIAALFAAQLLSDLDSRPRLYFSLLASSLLAVLLYFQISGSHLTIAWGVEGIALLAAGFPLRDRVLRLSGIALLLFCILKLFLFDLRHLETLPRILSFMVLGLILVAVSWVYTRFREVLLGQVLDLPHKAGASPEIL